MKTTMNFSQLKKLFFSPWLPKRFYVGKVGFITKWRMPCSRIQIYKHISNTFISTAKLKLAKNYAEAKQHPEAKLSTKISK